MSGKIEISRELGEKILYELTSGKLSIGTGAKLRALLADPAVERQEPVAWFDGAPTSPWASEWFIAVTTYGERVVLRELPEGYTYDFTTADKTYLMRDRIKKWMQFPDSDFVPFSPPAPVADGTTSDKYRAELYDEVWQKARDMGFNNVTDALAKLSAPVAVVLPERMKWDGLRATACNIRGEGWNACLDKVKEMNPCS